jgi:hypothetical protein
VGGALAATGPARYGWLVEGEVYPGGSWGRYGLRAELRGAETAIDSGWALVGLAYEAAATRPGLQIALHGDAGVAFPDLRPVVGAGVQVQLWLWGPITLGLDATGSLVVDGLQSSLVLASATTIRIAY